MAFPHGQSKGEMKNTGPNKIARLFLYRVDPFKVTIIHEAFDFLRC